MNIMRRIVILLSIVFFSIVAIGQQSADIRQDFGNFSSLIAQNKSKADQAKAKEQAAKAKAKEQAAKAKAKEQAAKAKAKEQAAKEKAKEQAAKEKAKEQAAKEKAKEQAAKEKAKEQAAKEKAKEQAAKEKAKEQVAKEKAKEQAAKDKAKEQAAKDKEKAQAAKDKEQEKKVEAKEKVAKEKTKESPSKAAKASSAKDKEKAKEQAAREKAKAQAAKEKAKADKLKAAEKAKKEKEKAKSKAATATAKDNKKAQSMKEKAKADQAKEKEKARLDKLKEIEKAKKDQAKEKAKAKTSKSIQDNKEQQKKQLAAKKAISKKESEKAHAKQMQLQKAAKKDNAKGTKSVTALSKPGIGAHPFRPSTKASTKFSYTALYLDGGASIAYTDYSTSKIPLSGYGSMTFMYHFTPLWGIGLNYTLHSLNVKPKYYNVVDEPDLSKLSYGEEVNGEQVYEVYKKHVKHLMNDVSVLLSFNLRNAWLPYTTKDLFNLYIMCGLGGSFYPKSNIYYYYERHNHSVDESHEEEATGQMRVYTREKEGASLVITPGLLFDFNITRSVSLGLKTMLNIYPQDHIEYWKSGNRSDMLLDLGFSARYKINAEKKTHTANIANMQPFITKAERRESAMAFDTDSLRKIMSTAQRVRDTLVIIHYDTVYMASNANGDGAYSTEHHQEDTTPLLQVMKSNVFFVPNSAALSDYSDNILKEVAQKMDEDQSIIAEIMGYNDLTGTEAANKKIALKRANIVANQLVNIYKIDRSRIKYIGQGVYKNSNAVQNTAVSRRAQIILYKP